MDCNKTVSIITPAYNAMAFIAETIESVILQTYPSWELIIIDDCSKDDTCKLVEAYIQKDSRIKLLKQKKNMGPALARDAGIQFAQGRYIAFLDSDDVWLADKLKKQIDFMNEMNSALSFTRFRRMTEEGDHLGRLIDIPDTLTSVQMLKNTAMGTSTVVIDRDMTGSFNMKNAPCDDLVLWIEILDRGFVASGLQEDLVRYRVVTSSFSRNKSKYARKVWKTYRYMGFNLFQTVWYFSHYAVRGVLKYRKF